MRTSAQSRARVLAVDGAQEGCVCEVFFTEDEFGFMGKLLPNE